MKIHFNQKYLQLTNYFIYSEKTSLDLSYTYIAGENGKKIIRVPRNLLKASVSSKISPKLYFNGSIKKIFFIKK